MNRNLATWFYMYATEWKIDICQSNRGTSQRIQSRIKPKIQWIEMTCRFKQKVNKEKFGFNMISSHWRTNNTHSCREIERNACAWHVCSFLVAIYWRKSAFIVFTLNKNICHVGISFLSECLSESVPMTCMFSMSSFRVIFIYLHCIAFDCMHLHSKPIQSLNSHKSSSWIDHLIWKFASSLTTTMKKNMKWIVSFFGRGNVFPMLVLFFFDFHLQ